MNSDFYHKVQQHISDCDKYGFPVDDLAVSIIRSAYLHSDEDVKRVLLSISPEIYREICSIISKFNKTGMFLQVWGSGQTEDLAEEMARVSRLIELDPNEDVSVQVE